MGINYSNLSAKEHFRLNGQVPEDMLETLLDRAGALESLGGLDAHLSEAKGCYPAEDFIEPIRWQLQELHKTLRGANREKLGGILESLDDLAQCIFNQTDYGRDELRKALNIIQAAGL